MDVEVVKPFDDFLSLNTVIGYENSKTKGLEVAAFGVESIHLGLKLVLTSIILASLLILMEVLIYNHFLV